MTIIIDNYNIISAAKKCAIELTNVEIEKTISMLFFINELNFGVCLNLSPYISPTYDYVLEKKIESFQVREDRLANIIQVKENVLMPKIL
jgi:hypothetical protein